MLVLGFALHAMEIGISFGSVGHLAHVQTLCLAGYLKIHDRVQVSFLCNCTAYSHYYS